MYNAEKYIERCIQSVLEQTYSDIEIIIIDDKSTDNTNKILEFYKENDRITIISSEENRGVSESRNIGLRISKGDYVTFVDADDVLPLNALEILYDVINEENADIVCGKVSGEISENKTIKEKLLIEKDNLKELIEKLISCGKYSYDLNNLGYACGKLYKRDILRNCFFCENIKFREDTLFNILAYQESNRVVAIHDVCYIYQPNENSASFKFFPDYMREIEDFFQILKSSVKFKNFDVQAIYVCGLYMYMNYLKHYAMHTDLQLKHVDVIKETFINAFWKKIFYDVNTKKLPIKYKILVSFYKKKCSYGIMFIYKINKLKKKFLAYED